MPTYLDAKNRCVRTSRHLVYIKKFLADIKKKPYDHSPMLIPAVQTYLATLHRIYNFDRGEVKKAGPAPAKVSALAIPSALTAPPASTLRTIAASVDPGEASWCQYCRTSAALRRAVLRADGAASQHATDANLAARDAARAAYEARSLDCTC